MSGDLRTDPTGIKPSTTNGDILTTTAGVAAWAPLAVTNDLPLVSVVNGVPGLVFDNAGHVVYTKGTS